MATLRGFKDISKALRDYQKETIQEVKELVSLHASDLQVRAKDSLKAYTGPSFLDNANFVNIGVKIEDQGLAAKVGDPSVGRDKKSWFAAYIEFGTGLSAESLLSGPEYTDEIRALAWKFKGAKDGTLKAHPYLFNNFFIVQDNFTKELNAFLKKRKQWLY